jgi:hypothetical protein
MKTILTKTPIPILWLDTWCILELAAALDSKDIKRKESAEQIVDKIILLTKKKKLICPEGDQDIEIRISNNKKIVEKSREIQAQMSLGISLNFYAAVEHLQIQRMMRAVINKKHEVEFSWKDIFADDPIRTIDKNDKFIVSVRISQSQEQIDEQIRVHKSIAQDWEALRQDARKNKRSYEITLAREFKGTAEAIVHVMVNIAAKTIHKLPISAKEYMQSVDLVGTPLSWWEHYSGKKDVLTEVLSFYASGEYSQIPFVNIGTRLLSELVSGNESVSPSDVMDIHHMATVIPYASFMVVDKRVGNRLEGRTQLLKDYPVKLLKLKEVLPLLESLDN